MKEFLPALLCALILLPRSLLAADCAPAGDPFAPSYRMPTGPMAGACLETHKRSYRLLSKDEAKRVVPAEFVERTQGVRYIANVNHNGEFWVGVFPLRDSIEKMTLEVERFPPRWIAAHVMMRLDFKSDRPVLLFSQTDPARAPITQKHLALSVEGLGIKDGPKYGLATSLQDYFALSKRIVSVEDKIKTEIIDEKNTIRQYGMKLTSRERDRLFEKLLTDMHDPEMTQMYHLLNKNCMNHLFEIIDRYLGRSRNWFDRVATVIPTTTHSALKARGLSDGSKLPTLNEEIKQILAWDQHTVCPYYFRDVASSVVPLTDAAATAR